jgi:hypothetical protein
MYCVNHGVFWDLRGRIMYYVNHGVFRGLGGGIEFGNHFVFWVWFGVGKCW